MIITISALAHLRSYPLGLTSVRLLTKGTERKGKFTPAPSSGWTETAPASMSSGLGQSRFEIGTALTKLLVEMKSENTRTRKGREKGG